ncbi:hypothetical protein CWI36_0432p0020 [Hamiltosporidium magnivora]|uniref:Uncharacterized protein n=1 Tax=Hamiltosporidium magnivora TaxID=148818 RepID=A0A4Q9LEX1_9MICR|nr:hypothetical protein CWI36_0432p0020 [Hamiltosporidium magnivora]
MLRVLYVKDIEKQFAMKKCHFSFFILLNIFYSVYVTNVEFIVINDENYTTGLSISDLPMKMTDSEIYFEELINEEYKIIVYKNNILRFESYNQKPRYYNPNIMEIPYRSNMLLSSRTLRQLFESKKANIKIIFRDISYSSLLLFLKLIDNPDIVINQIKVREFLDILMIISVLDIKKTKERNNFLKELLRNMIFTMKDANTIFDFEKYYKSYHYKHIKNSILMDMLIFFIEQITFNDKSAQRIIVLSDMFHLNINFTTVFFSHDSQQKQKFEDKVCLRLDSLNITKLHKMIDIEHLRKTWRFILQITRLELLYLILLSEDIYEKAIRLFESVTLHTKKLYILCFKNPIRLFRGNKVPLFSPKLKEFKLKYYFKTEELKDILNLFSGLQRITLVAKTIDFEKLKLLVEFSMKNKTTLCKIFCSIYESLNTEIALLRLIPSNLLFYIDYFEHESYSKQIPIHYMPFFYYYSYRYMHIRGTGLPNNIIFFDCSNFKNIILNFKHNSSLFELDNSAIISLRYFKAVKYFSLYNVFINNELFLYILESNTIIFFGITNFGCEYNFDFLKNSDTVNRKLKTLLLKNSPSYIDSRILDFLDKFKCVTGLKLINLKTNYYKAYLKEVYEFFFRTKKRNENKICLKCLEIINILEKDNLSNILNIISETYELSRLSKITFEVYRISEAEYHFLNEMKELKVLSIRLLDRVESLNFEKLFINYGSLDTIVSLIINIGRIRKKDIEFFKRLKNPAFLSISCDIIDYETIKGFKRNDFRTTILEFAKPARAERSVEINNYLDSDHSVQEILDNEYAEIRVDTRIKTDVKIRNNRPDIFILDKKKNKITLIEVGITS